MLLLLGSTSLCGPNDSVNNIHFLNSVLILKDKQLIFKMSTQNIKTSSYNTLLHYSMSFSGFLIRFHQRHHLQQCKLHEQHKGKVSTATSINKSLYYSSAQITTEQVMKWESCCRLLYLYASSYCVIYKKYKSTWKIMAHCGATYSAIDIHNLFSHVIKVKIL